MEIKELNNQDDNNNLTITEDSFFFGRYDGIGYRDDLNSYVFFYELIKLLLNNQLKQYPFPLDYKTGNVIYNFNSNEKYDESYC